MGRDYAKPGNWLASERPARSHQRKDFSGNETACLTVLNVQYKAQEPQKVQFECKGFREKSSTVGKG